MKENPSQSTIKTVSSTASRPEIKKTGFYSAGEAFWFFLPQDKRSEIEPLIEREQEWLTRHFLPDFQSPYIIKARKQALQRIPEIQTDPDTCTIIATGNAFRILDGPNQAYTQTGILDRMELIHGARWRTIWPDTLRSIVDSGEPFDKFKTTSIPTDSKNTHENPNDFLKLLKAFESGAVATLDWKISPGFRDFPGSNTTHARTIAGFSVNGGSLYFHLIDPFRGRVEPWLFRDLIAATGSDYGLDASSVVRITNAVSRQANLIELASTNN